jgi:hypothetical protein
MIMFASNMKYLITVMRQVADDAPLELAFGQTLPAVSNESSLLQDISLVTDEHRTGRVTSSRPVVVQAIDPEVFKKFDEATAGVRPANGLYAQPVAVGQMFESGAALARHLGLKNNEVTMFLNRAKHVEDPGKRTAKLRGVVFAYQSDVEAAMMENVRD